MPDVRSFFQKDYLYAFHLDGRECTVTIEKVTQGAVPGRDKATGKETKTRKPLVFFKGKSKPLALNITNVKTIAGMYGFKAEDWVGKRVTLFPTTCEAFGKTEDCIRVKPSIPKASAPEGKIDEAAQPPEREAGADDDEGAVA